MGIVSLIHLVDNAIRLAGVPGVVPFMVDKLYES